MCIFKHYSEQQQQKQKDAQHKEYWKITMRADGGYGVVSTVSEKKN